MWSSCSCFKSIIDSVDAVIDGFGDLFPDAALGAYSANGTEAVAFSSDDCPFPLKYSNSLSESDADSCTLDGGEMSSTDSSDAAGISGFWPACCEGAMF